VDEEGRVGLSASWAADPVLRYGDARQDETAWRRGAGYQQLLSLLDADPAPDEVCAACEHNRICGGVLRALGARSCATWQEIFLRLRLVAGRLQRDARKPRGRRDG
jgi:hypothetical protein